MCDLNYNKEEREAKTLTGCEPCFKKINYYLAVNSHAIIIKK
jgi:hypothetical protein